MPTNDLMRSGRSLPSVAVGVDSLPVMPKSALALSSAGGGGVVERLVTSTGDVEEQPDALALAVGRAASGSGSTVTVPGLHLPVRSGRGGGGAAGAVVVAPRRPWSWLPAVVVAPPAVVVAPLDLSVAPARRGQRGRARRASETAVSQPSSLTHWLSPPCVWDVARP